MFGIDLMATVKALETFAASMADISDLSANEQDIAQAGIFARTLAELDGKSRTFANVMLLCKDFLAPIVIPHS